MEFLRCSSVAKCLSGMCEALGSIPNGGDKKEGSAAWGQPNPVMLSVRHWDWFGIAQSPVFARMITCKSTQREGSLSYKAAAHPDLGC